MINGLEPLPALADNYIWMVASDDGVRWLAVDPGDAEPVSAFLRARTGRLAAVLLTHHHGDHVGGAAQLAALYGAPVYGPGTESIAAVDHPLHGGERLQIDGFKPFTVIATPGHTAGHIAYHCTDRLFSGDALFAGGCGRLFEGSAATLLPALQRLSSLPASTQLCCGHEYTVKNLEFAAQVEPANSALIDRLALARQQRAEGKPTLPSNLADEWATNPFLRTAEADVVAAAQAWAGKRLADEVAVLAALRRWKDAS